MSLPPPEFAPPQRGIDAAEITCQCQHRAKHIFGDSDLMAVNIDERRIPRKGSAIDTVKAGAGHLH